MLTYNAGMGLEGLGEVPKNTATTLNNWREAAETQVTARREAWAHADEREQAIQRQTLALRDTIGEMALSQVVQEPWRQEAACRGLDPDMFFPQYQDQEEEAKQVCRTCPVADECLDYAITHKEEHGIWGGMNHKERNAAKRRRAG
jgi:WhiB family redox-sensing transcriptional regulator